MASARAVTLLLCTAGLAGCGGGRRIGIDPDEAVVGTRWNAVLATPRELAGAMQLKGSGWLDADDGDTTQTRAFVRIENAVPGGAHPWHVHVGQCGADRGILGPAEAYEPLIVGDGGTAEESASVPVPFPRAGQYFINVHASANNMGTTIACGNLAPPSQ
jgi:hypothetical protein